MVLIVVKMAVRMDNAAGTDLSNKRLRSESDEPILDKEQRSIVSGADGSAMSFAVKSTTFAMVDPNNEKGTTCCGMS